MVATQRDLRIENDLPTEPKFHGDYNRFKREPGAANLFLLLCELADATGPSRLRGRAYVRLAARSEDEAYQTRGTEAMKVGLHSRRKFPGSANPV